MPNKQVLPLIHTLIKKTKDGSLIWNKYSELMPKIKNLPINRLDNSFDQMLNSSEEYISKGIYLDPYHSYVSSFASGTFFLLLYTSILEENTIVLRVQTESSETSKIYASTENESNVDILSNLKRLYTLIDSTNATMDIDTFIDNFIKSE